MNLYELRVLYPSSNESPKSRQQSFRVDLKARNHRYVGNSLVFRGKNYVVAVYPSQYTIIERIKYNVE